MKIRRIKIMSNDTIKRATGLLVIEAVNSNPNGNPDMDSDPRQRANGCGEISPVSYKRKLRDLVGDHKGAFFQSLPEKFRKDESRYQILESRDRDLAAVNAEMGDDPAHFLDSDFVHKYWDARLFGNTLLDQGRSKDFIKTGVVQFGMGVSIAPINIVRQTNTKMASVEANKQGGMAPLGYRVVEHGVYCMPFFVNPNYAHKSGCTLDDVELMKQVIPYAYDLTRSAIRPDVRLRHAWYVEHKNALGSCPDHMIIDALTPKLKDGTCTRPSSWADYQDSEGLPEDILGMVDSVVDLCRMG
jgi:CRISPR-associated protein Csd2